MESDDFIGRQFNLFRVGLARDNGHELLSMFTFRRGQPARNRRMGGGRLVALACLRRDLSSEAIIKKNYRTDNIDIQL